MKLNLKNLALAGSAVFALTACNSNDEQQVGVKSEADVKVAINIPTSATRAIVEAPSNGTIKIKTVDVRVMKGNKVVGSGAVPTDEIADSKNSYTVTIPSLLVDGTEQVEVVVNGIKGNAGVAVESIQPTANAADLTNMVYTAKTADLGDKTGDTYKVTADAKSTAARLEIHQAPKFNTQLVKSMELSYVSPAKYTLVYGLPDIQEKTAGGILELKLTSDQSKSLIGKDYKVTAHHIFAGDPTRVSIGFNIEKYVSLKTAQGKYIVYPNNGKNCYIYKVGDDKYVVNYGANLETPEFHDAVVTPVGDTYSVKVAQEKNTAVTKADIEIDNATEYFTLNKFTKATSGKYESGYIYRINLESGMKWGSAGSDHEDEYTPDENEGIDTPDPIGGEDQEESTIEATVDILPWTIEDTSVSVN